MPLLGFDSLMPKMAGWHAASETPATVSHWTESGRWSSPALLDQECNPKPDALVILLLLVLACYIE